MALENFTLLKNLLINKRFRQDIKSLKSAKKCYNQYAWELLEELNLNQYIQEPKSLDQICKFAQIKDKKFIETVLDILVGNNNLGFEKNKYFVKSKPKNEITSELKHLEQFCPGSTEWTHWLRSKSTQTLKLGKKFETSSFDAKKGIHLWEQVMKESPYSLRQITISQIKNKLKDNKKIIDVGCGGGIGLEEILLKTNSKIQLFGLEVSENYLKIAKKRITKLSKELTGQKKENSENVKYIKHNLLKKPLSEKFDGIFISLVINHIHQKDYKLFFENLKEMLTDDGTLVTFQFVNTNKFQRSPMWVMHNIPSHKEFPYKDELVTTLKSIFPNVKILFGGTIIVCKLR